jgi:hypothetical protein
MPAHHLKTTMTDASTPKTDPAVTQTVTRIIADVRDRDDDAVREAARVKLFEGHARSRDVRAIKFGDATLAWVPPEPALR